MKVKWESPVVQPPRKHVTPPKKKGKGVTGRNSYLTWKHKTQIHDFKQAWLSDNKELSIHEQGAIINSPSWRAELTDYLRMRDSCIGEEDVGRWIHAHPWIKDPLGTIPQKKVPNSSKLDQTNADDDSFMVPINSIPLVSSWDKTLPSRDDHSAFEDTDIDMDSTGVSLSPPILSPQAVATAVSVVTISATGKRGIKGRNQLSNERPPFPLGKRIYNVGENESILRRVLETDDITDIITQTPEQGSRGTEPSATSTAKRVEQTISNPVVDKATPSTSSESYNIQFLKLSPSVAIVVKHGPDEREPLNGSTVLEVGGTTQETVPEGEPMDLENGDEGANEALDHTSRLPDLTITEAEDYEPPHSIDKPIAASNGGAEDVVETPGAESDQGELIVPNVQKTPPAAPPSPTTVPSSLGNFSSTLGTGSSTGPLPAFAPTFFPNGNVYGTLNGNTSSQSSQPEEAAAGPSTSSTGTSATIPGPRDEPATPTTAADVREVIKNVKSAAFANPDLLKSLDPADDNNTNLENFNKMIVIIEGMLSVANMVKMDESVKGPLRRLGKMVNRLMDKDILPHNHGDAFVKVVNASATLSSIKKEISTLLTPSSSKSSINNSPPTCKNGVQGEEETDIVDVSDVGCEVEVVGDFGNLT